MKTKKDCISQLEKLRGIFFSVGLVIALTLTLLAFEWKHYDNTISYLL